MVLQLDKLGKSVKDLFGKKYDFTGLTIETSNTSSGNVSVESVGNWGDSVTGQSKLEWNEAKLKAVVQLSTSDDDKNTKAEITLNKVAPGVDVTVSSNSVPDVALKAVYSNDNVAATFKANRNLADDSTAFSLAATAGKDGVTVGGDVHMDLAANLTDYNLGLQYDNKDLTATVMAKKQFSKINGCFYYKNFPVLDNTVVGACVDYNLKDGSSNVGLGFQNELDANTTIKTKFNLAGNVATVVEHRLADPRLTVALASNYEASSGRLQATGMGLNLKWA